MTINPRIVLICATCIILSGLFGSYKSFQIYEDQIIQSQVQKNEKVSQFAAQNIEQKLMQMEAAVSYLDQSTIETLKRLGARYFAYAFQKDGEWNIKWKVLGETGKELILEEVNPLPFSEYNLKVRHWARSKKNKLIYITPVELAESHQLKKGFLIFGLSGEFFSTLKTHGKRFALVDAQKSEIFGSFPSFLNKEAIAREQEAQTGLYFENVEDGLIQLTTAGFVPKTQMWILNQDSMQATSFFASRFFTYFVLTSGFGLLLLVLFLMNQNFPLQRKSFGSMGSVFSKINIPDFAAMLKRESTDVDTETTISEEGLSFSAGEEVIEDFADYLDRLLVDEHGRLQKLGISLKTQIEEGAKVICSPKKVADFIQRLIGNSVLSLDGEKEKEIQIQLVEQSEAYQLIYVDTRTENFPSGKTTALMAQTEGSLQGIDGIIAYAGWLFGESLTVAKKGFCLSVDLQKAGLEKVSQANPVAVVPMLDHLERVEIDDMDTDYSLISGFSAIEPAKIETEASASPEEDKDRASFDDVIDQFRMKEFSFAPTTVDDDSKDVDTLVEEALEDLNPTSENVELKTDDKGLFEFNSGQFKIKIRSPKKRGSDVDR